MRIEVPVQLVDPEKGAVENLTLEFSTRRPLPIYFFDKFKSYFKNGPLLVHCGKTERAFIPGLMSFELIVYDEETSAFKVRITQLGTEIFSLDDNIENEPIKFFLVNEKPESFQHPIFLNEVVGASLKYEVEEENSMGLQLIYAEKPQYNAYHRTDLDNWKGLLTSYGGDIFYYDLDSHQKIQVYTDGFVHNDQAVHILPMHMIRKDDIQQKITIRPFMIFIIENASFKDEEYKNCTYQALGTSFLHSLTKVGRNTVNRMKKCIDRRFEAWKTSEKASLIAPISSICQYSGSGKSKLSSEFTNKGPGLNIVLRESGINTEDAYPPGNDLSTELFDLFSKAKPDVPTDLTMLSADETYITPSVLHFFASVIFTYYQELVDITVQLMDTGLSVEEALKNAYPRAGPKANSGTSYELKYGDMKTKFAGKAVKDIADEIEKILKYPGNYFAVPQVEDKKEKYAAACSQLQKQIEKFPFILVIDEAHQLAKIKRQLTASAVKTVTGFQLLRRALSYLNPGTPLFVLTLGTRSVILDMNPPHLDSFRGAKRTDWAAPIVLSGNFDINKHEAGLTYYKFTPTYQTLRNPLVFKMLASMGSPLWSSIPFPAIVNLAATKLRNSERANGEDVFVSWMIRTGMFANPKSAEAENLVAHRMADLFNLKNDSRSVSVFYPGQPVMGMAARKICHDGKSQKMLFQSLALNSSLVSVDRGQLAESMAFMSTMLAVDKSKNQAYRCNSLRCYLKCLSKIINASPQLEKLWRKTAFILESEDGGNVVEPQAQAQAQAQAQPQPQAQAQPQLPSPSSPEQGTEQENQAQKKKEDLLEKLLNTNFLLEDFSLEDLMFIVKHFTEEELNAIPRANPWKFAEDYHVTTVKNFLLSLYGEDFAPYLMLFPESTLEGIVNASHFVKLPNACSLDKNKEYGRSLPLPNNFVKDTGRLIIDRALLKLGLIRQCGFALPPNYFGIDAIIPVCLKGRNKANEPIYTFIAIQVKAEERADFEHVLKMQSRLHFGNCPRDDLHLLQVPPQPFAACKYCCTNQELAEIYENQIGLIVSFGEECKRIPNQSSITQYAEPLIDTSEALKLLYNWPETKQRYALKNPKLADPKFTAVVEKKLANMKISIGKQLPSKSFYHPRLVNQFDVNYRIRIFSCLWDESLKSTIIEEVEDDKTNADAKLGSKERLFKRVKLEEPTPKPTPTFLPYNGNQRLQCISSRTFAAFRHLYQGGEEDMQFAEKLLNAEWVIGDESTIDLENMAYALLNEGLVPEYNEFLLKMRNESVQEKDYEKFMEIIIESASKQISHIQ